MERHGGKDHNLRITGLWYLSTAFFSPPSLLTDPDEPDGVANPTAHAVNHRLAVQRWQSPREAGEAYETVIARYEDSPSKRFQSFFVKQSTLFALCAVSCSLQFS